MKDPMEDVRQRLARDFYATLERKLAEGLRLGLDVAAAIDGFPLEIRFVSPGERPPSGRRWTLYRTSEGLSDGVRLDDI